MLRRLYAIQRHGVDWEGAPVHLVHLVPDGAIEAPRSKDTSLVHTHRPPPALSTTHRDHQENAGVKQKCHRRLAAKGHKSQPVAGPVLQGRVLVAPTASRQARAPPFCFALPLVLGAPFEAACPTNCTVRAETAHCPGGGVSTAESPYVCRVLSSAAMGNLNLFDVRTCADVATQPGRGAHGHGRRAT